MVSKSQHNLIIKKLKYKFVHNELFRLISVNKINVICIIEKKIYNFLKNITHILIFSDNNLIIDFISLVNLVYIKFNRFFNKIINNLPQNIKYLKFGDQFNQLINNLPNGVLCVVFGLNFIQDLNYLPNSIILIKFKHLCSNFQSVKLRQNIKLQLINLPNSTFVKITTSKSNNLISRFKSFDKLIIEYTSNEHLIIINIIVLFVLLNYMIILISLSPILIMCFDIYYTIIYYYYFNYLHNQIIII